MKKRGISLVLSAILAVGVLAGCSNKKQDDLKTLRVGFFPNLTHSQALVGKNRGDFQNALGNNINIEWKQFNAGSSEIEAFLAGELDLGYIGPGPAINGFTKSKGDVVIIAGSTDAGAVLVSRKGTSIKTVKDLDGKKVAIPQFGNTQDLSLRYLLQEAGLKDKAKGGTVEIVQAENPDIKTLIEKGEIDAALVPEPWGARLEKESGANLVLDYNQIWREGKYPTAVVIARKEFLKDHADVVEKFLKTHVELTDYINSNQSEAGTIANKEIEALTKKAISQSILDTAFKRISVTYNPETAATKEMINLSLSAGFIKEKPADTGLFDLTILNKVLKEKGKEEAK